MSVPRPSVPSVSSVTGFNFAVPVVHHLDGTHGPSRTVSAPGNPAKRLSKLRFSCSRIMTCLILCVGAGVGPIGVVLVLLQPATATAAASAMNARDFPTCTSSNQYGQALCQCAFGIPAACRICDFARRENSDDCRISGCERSSVYHAYFYSTLTYSGYCSHGVQRCHGVAAGRVRSERFRSLCGAVVTSDCGTTWIVALRGSRRIGLRSGSRRFGPLLGLGPHGHQRHASPGDARRLRSFGSSNCI